VGVRDEGPAPVMSFALVTQRLRKLTGPDGGLACLVRPDRFLSAFWRGWGARTPAGICVIEVVGVEPTRLQSEPWTSQMEASAP
jgi:hypothetical protein